MAIYTTELQSLCKSELIRHGIDVRKLTPFQIIEQSIPYVYNFDFPIFDENYRKTLLINITQWYYTREIGLETVMRWKLFLQAKLNLIMPKYNLLYQNQLIKMNPLINSFENENFIKEASGTSQDVATSEEQNKSNSNSVYSDTPQGLLNNLDYATNATTDEISQSTTQSANSNSQADSTEKYIREKTGMSGSSLTKLITEFQFKFKTIDMMIIEDISDMFMNIYSYDDMG